MDDDHSLNAKNFLIEQGLSLYRATFNHKAVYQATTKVAEEQPESAIKIRIQVIKEEGVTKPEAPPH